MSNLGTFKPTSNTYSFLYRIFDISAIFLSLELAELIYVTSYSHQYMITALVVTVIFLNLAEFLDLYRSWRVGRFSQMILTTWLCIIISFAVMLLGVFLLKQSETYSRVIMGLWFIFSFISISSWRAIYRSHQRTRLKAGIGVQNVAIIGATEAGHNLHIQMQRHFELGYEFKGFFDDRSHDRLPKYIHVNGIISEVLDMAKRGELHILFVALPINKNLENLLVRLGDTTVDVHFVPDFLLSNLIRARIDHVGDIDTLSVFESPYHGAKEWLKRAEDIIFGSIILVLITVPMLFIALAIKLTSKGPVLFKQHRYGLGGQEILVWKFRSMTVAEDGGKVIQATKNDSRVTPLGRFLRRTSLDELPQFINVLFGGMSIVGPRPHAVVHNEEFRKKVEFYMIRHKVKPGITGWAQINGWRGETDTLEKMEQRIKYDLHYINNWSLWFDIKIIFLTIIRGFIGKNAY